MTVTDRFRVDGKTAIVTGASTGLGKAFALALAQAGANVVLAARRQPLLIEAATQIHKVHGHQPEIVTADVIDPADCERIVAAGVQRFGGVDILVNNAGVSDAVPALKQTPDDFRRVIDVNLNGTYWMAQACARAMSPGAAIVNISSILGLTRGDVPSAGYSASKAGVIGLTRDLANQWSARRGIRVNALAPGYFETEMTAPLVGNPALHAKVLNRTPMRRFGVPDELCSAMLFLASDASSYITGVTLPVDGGWSMP